MASFEWLLAWFDSVGWLVGRLVREVTFERISVTITVTFGKNPEALVTSVAVATIDI